MDKSHEAIVQLRNCDQELIDRSKAILKEMNAVIKRSFLNKAKGKIEVDWYLKRKDDAKKLIDKLSKEYLGEKEITAKLHTKDKTTGKKIYKITAKFSKFPFNKGSKILFNDEEFDIIDVKGKYLIVKQRNEKLSIPLNKLKNFRVLEK